MSDEEKIIKVNQYINNQFLYTDDFSIWGKIDYWSTPLEMFGKLAGDCEDFAILKYLSLLHIGIDPLKLRISYVKIHNRYSSSKDEAHMVLKYIPDSKTEPKILDSIVKDIYPSSRRLDLKPFYDFNHRHVFVNNDPTTYTIDKISKWKDCIERMKPEGINLF